MSNGNATATPKLTRSTVDRRKQRLTVSDRDGHVKFSDEKEITVAVNGVDPGIRVSVSLGVDGQTVFLEAYHWRGSKQPIRIVSTVTGEPIDLHQLPDCPHPELAITEAHPEAPAVGAGVDLNSMADRSDD